jgi:hypothetical protein
LAAYALLAKSDVSFSLRQMIKEGIAIHILFSASAACWLARWPSAWDAPVAYLIAS